MTAGELFHLLLPRISKMPAGDEFLNGLNNAILVITRRLLYRKSSLIKSGFRGSVRANTSGISLPDGYLGFCPDAPPTIAGKTLLPLPPFKYGSYSAAGSPEYYDTRSGRINLYPTPADAIVITALYFQKPDRLTSPDDELPWEGIIDDLIGEAVIAISRTGQWGSITAEWEALISREVDRLASTYASRVAEFVPVNLIAR